MKGNQIFIGTYNMAGALSFSGLVLSITACILSFNHNFEFAIICLIYAGLCDLFDGVIARRLNASIDQQQFGLHIDSLVDVIAFGLAPMIVLLHMGFNNIFDHLLLIFYCCCAAMRLAVFNQSQQNKKAPVRTYIGIPVTYAALVFPLVFTMGTFMNDITYLILIRLTVASLGLLFILKIPIPKPRGVFYVIFPIIAVILTLFWLKRGL